MITALDQPRIGVYVCHCGGNIAGAIPVAELTAFARGLPHVVLARHYKYMCSDPGQQLIQQDIVLLQLNRVVVAACSPLVHEKTFQRAAEDAGINPFLVQIANLREHVAWVATDAALAARKAKAQLAAAVHRVAGHRPLERKAVPITPRVLVVGGGIAGIQAALTLADAGKEVILVEREPTLGGHVAMFDKTFPGLECTACVLTPKMTAVKDHPKIRLLTCSEVQAVEGTVGSYRARILRRARYVNEDLCVGCMRCVEECLFTSETIPNAFDHGLGTRKPIYMPFPQAVPRVPVIDREACLRLVTGKCAQSCVEACGDRGAIDFRQEDRVEEHEVGAIIVATGFQAFDPSPIDHYGYGRYPGVYTALEVERLLNSAGPTEGKVVLRDGSTPKAVGIAHCVGSRDHHYHAYCSRVCCMYSLKLAQLIRERTGAEVYSFYIDIRAPGKACEEFYEEVQQSGVHFIRGKLADVGTAAEHGVDRPGGLVATVEDTLQGRVRRIALDMLVLSVALEPREGAETIRRMFGMTCSSEGFFQEKHPKLAPVNTANDGVLVAGACQGPKDIADSVAQADAAAAQALVLVDRGQIDLEPNTAWIDQEACSGCKTCIPLCPYHAIRRDEDRKTAVVDEALCKGCGVCAAACPSAAAQQRLFTDQQIYDEIEGLLSYG